MKSTRALLLMLFVSQAACTDTLAKPDAGTADGGATDAAQDVQSTDGAPRACNFDDDASTFDDGCVFQ